MALRTYFDGSKAEAVSMTLAAIAADEEVWSEFEDVWKAVLLDRGQAPYMHMREAMSLKGAFEGWDIEKRDHLIYGLQSLLTIYSDKRRFNVFSCTIDLQAHKRWRSKNPAKAEDICTDQVLQKVFAWYRDFPDLILAPMELFFDRNEKFRGRLYNEWNNKKTKED